MEYVEESVIVHEEVAEKKLLEALVALLGSRRFELWFGSEPSLRFEGERIVFSVKNRFAADWIRSNFQGEIEQAARQVFGKSFAVAFTVRKPETSPDGPVLAPHCLSGRPEKTGKDCEQHISSRPEGKIVPSIAVSKSPLYSVETSPASPRTGRPGRKSDGGASRSEGTFGRRFESMQTFVEGMSNRLACRAAQLAIEHPGRINPIYLFGPTSVGKTHLLEGIWTEIRRRPGSRPPFYMTSEQFVSSFLESIQPGSSRSGIQGFRNKFKGISVLLIDDVQYLFRKDATQTEFLYTIDTLCGRGVQLVLTGDRPLRELNGLRREIVCRLEAGMVCGIEQPERETALRIFQNMVARRRLPIGPDVCRMVTSRLGRHARQLSGALNRLHAVYLAGEETITPESAEKVLADLIRENRRDVRLQDIEKVVCETFGLSEESLQSKSRTRQIAAPRMLAMWLARKYTRSALSEIGRYFGDRSHSTVVTAQKKVDRWVDENHPIHAEHFEVPISEAIRKIERKLQSG